MSITRIGWISDTHIGFNQYGLNRRRLDFEYAFMDAIQSMIDKGVQAIIHAGDLIHSTRPSPTDMLFIRSIDRQLRNNDLAMFIVSGNHDRSTPHWIDTVTDGGSSNGLQRLDNRTVAIDKILIAGCPYASVEDFRARTFPNVDILVLHQLVKDYVGFDVPNALSLKDMPKGPQLIAIGDIHVNDVRRVDGAWVGYAGSTEMNRESESENKVWKLVTFGGRKLESIADVAIKTRPVIRIDIKTENDIPDAFNRIRTEHRSKVADGETRKPMVFIRYQSDIGNLLTRFRVEFDPDEYVLRFNPILKMSLGPNATQVDCAEDDVNMEDLIKSVLESRNDLIDIVSRLADPNTEASAVADNYIEQRLEKIQTEKSK